MGSSNRNTVWSKIYPFQVVLSKDMFHSWKINPFRQSILFSWLKDWERRTIHLCGVESVQRHGIMQGTGMFGSVSFGLYYFLVLNNIVFMHQIPHFNQPCIHAPDTINCHRFFFLLWRGGVGHDTEISFIWSTSNLVWQRKYIRSIVDTIPDAIPDTRN